MGNTSWIKIERVTTRSGTKPDNSEWAKINLPGLYRIEGGKIIDVPRTDYSDSCCDNNNKNWECDEECQKKMKEYVEVPGDKFPPGKYVLSFRWDSQQNPQVWNS